MLRWWLVLLTVSTFPLCLSEEPSRSQSQSTESTVLSGRNGHVTWAVDVDSSHWLLGQLSEAQLKARADSLAAQFGLVNKGALSGFRTIFKFDQSAPSELVESSNHLHRRDLGDVDRKLKGHSHVKWSSRQNPLIRTKRSFNDPKFQAQWHLVNTREAGHDINVQEVWSLNITGKGVVIAVVDDGVEHSNVDLADNYNAAGSYDLNGGDLDPSPNLRTNVDNAHGTKCAGLIAAVANNSVCGVGVAYGAQVSGLRILDGTVTDLLEGQSFIYKAHINWIYSCSWGPEDNGMSVEGPGYIAKKALELGTSYGRYGYGNIFVFASGNGGLVDDNCNFDGYANSIFTLTVGAVDEFNKMPYYAEPCPNTLAVTYSNGHAMNDRTIVTTDTSTKGGCTKGFTGTSAAAPIAAGMVALMLEVRPCLSWRDVQSILVYSAVKVDIKEAQWVLNGAGFHHSDQHGFGLMDASRLTLTAAHWPLLPPMMNFSTSRQQVEAAIHSDAAPLTRTVYVSSASLPAELSTLEYIAVYVKLRHKCRGALEISLQSPTFTWTTLASSRKHDKSRDGLNGWTFTSARFWGESPNGIWMLKVLEKDNVCSDKTRKGGVLKEWTLTLYGSKVTSEEISKRRSIVEASVSNGTLEGRLVCPPLPENVEDIHLPVSGSKQHAVWEKVLLVVVAVLFGVLLIHLITDFIRNRWRAWHNRWRAWHRQRQLLANTTVAYSRLEGGRGSGEESESEETSLLIYDHEITLEILEHSESSTQGNCNGDCVNKDGESDSDLPKTSAGRDSDNYGGSTPDVVPKEDLISAGTDSVVENGDTCDVDTEGERTTSDVDLDILPK